MRIHQEMIRRTWQKPDDPRNAGNVKALFRVRKLNYGLKGENEVLSELIDRLSWVWGSLEQE